VALEAIEGALLVGVEPEALPKPSLIKTSTISPTRRVRPNLSMASELAVMLKMEDTLDTRVQRLDREELCRS
jgi:hypothetical protein